MITRRKPPVIEDVIITEIELGGESPVFSNFHIVSCMNEGASFVFDVGCHFRGTMKVRFLTGVQVPKTVKSIEKSIARTQRSRNPRNSRSPSSLYSASNFRQNLDKFSDTATYTSKY